MLNCTKSRCDDLIMLHARQKHSQLYTAWFQFNQSCPTEEGDVFTSSQEFQVKEIEVFGITDQTSSHQILLLKINEKSSPELE
jgi:alkyl hydroperoxide reductase subunit AhpC